MQKREELTRPGVYIIYGLTSTENDQISLYIGEGDPALPRLQAHYRNKDERMEFWTNLICFTAAENLLTKSHIQHLEARLIDLATTAKRCKLVNRQRQELPTLSEAQAALTERFLKNMLECLAVLGFNYFEPTSTREVSGFTYTFKTKDVTAQGVESSNGFIVKAGSTATKQVTSTYQTNPSLLSMRQQLLTNGLLADTGDVLTFVSDHEFSSPSSAAALVWGSSANGRVAWKREDGTTLKSVQEQRLQDTAPQTP